MEPYQVDLTLFHYGKDPERPQKPLDIFNACTGFWACRFLEWSGWYNGNFALRLLGHYRLFQIFKRKSKKLSRVIPLTRAYILQYRSGHVVKYFISRTMAYIHRGFTGEPYPFVEIESFNETLLYDRFSVLEMFLTEADIDFTAALRKTLAVIAQPDFFDRGSGNGAPSSQTLILQVQQVFNSTHYHYHSYTHHEINFQMAIQQGAKGKEKGVLSKWQILVFFDLLAQSAKLEKIDLSRPNRFDGYAEFLHALTGKAKGSWIDELKDYRGKDLYEYHKDGQLDEIINGLANLADKLRAAGLRSMAILADKKIIELENHRTNRKDGPQTGS